MERYLAIAKACFPANRMAITTNMFIQRPATLGQARLGAGIRTRETLFEVLRRELRLPDYFGENWDALADCLRDLSWIDERRVAIEHAELPQLNEDDLSIYLDLLAECVKDWKPTDDHKLVIVFPDVARAALSAAMRQQ